MISVYLKDKKGLDSVCVDLDASSNIVAVSMYNEFCEDWVPVDLNYWLFKTEKFMTTVQDAIDLDRQASLDNERNEFHMHNGEIIHN